MSVAVSCKSNIVPPKAVIFDWDDTITNNWWRVFRSMNKTLDAMGYKTWNDEEAHRNLGASGRDVFPKIFGDKWQQASDLYYKFLDETRMNAPEPLSGAVEAIRELAENTNLYLAVLSNKRGDYLRQEVKALNLDSCFAKIIGAGDCDEDKPSHIALSNVIKESDVALGSEVWFVGDSPTDMKCAHNGNCTAVMIETKLPPKDMLGGIEPHLSFSSCLELKKYLLNEFYEEIGLIISKTQCR